MKHIDALHLIPWKAQVESMTMTKDLHNCNKCDFLAETQLMLDDHIKEKHADDIEVLLTEGVNDASEEIDLEEREGEVNGVIEERECPTPIPDNVVICAECNIGFSTSEDVTHHIQINHQEETQDQSKNTKTRN